MNENYAQLKAVISVLGKDRPGIVAHVSALLMDAGANIDDINQSILQNMFAMTMLVTLNENIKNFNEVQNKLSALGEQLGLEMRISREDLYESMYKI